MGNTTNFSKDSYFMNIKIIGSNMDKFYEELKKSQQSIKELWKFENLEKKTTINQQINNYFNKLFNNLDGKKIPKKDIREVLILKVKNILDIEVSLIIDFMDQLDEVQYMPLVLLLYTEKIEQKLEIDRNFYHHIDPRLIFISRFSDDPEIIKNEIDPILLRFCSIHNDLGDRFIIGDEEKNNENGIDLIEKYFPFNINIACIGRFRQGKSTGVNEILQEYKAKESSKGCSQTKNLTYYQVKGKPIRVLDIPGFADEETVNIALAKLQECGKKINSLKEKLHIILYFLNYASVETFMNLEAPIIKEIMKHKKSKIIFVVTHSQINMSDNDKKCKIRNINLGIQVVLENNKIKDNGMFKADLNNVVFVNFHKDYTYNVEAFGRKELYKKIYEFFIQSEDFINSFINLSNEGVEENASRLRKQAQDVLLSNKISGGIIGAIPIVDLIVQKYLIKKNAVKKAGEIFGFNIELIEKENEKKNLGEDFEKEDENKIHRIKTTSSAGGYLSGGISIGNGVAKATNASKMVAEASRMSLQATNLGAESVRMGADAIQIGAKAVKMGEEAAKISEIANNISAPWYIRWFTSEVTTQASILASKAANMASESANLNSIATNMSAKAANLASESANLSANAGKLATNAAVTSSTANALKCVGTGVTVVSIVIGVSLGAYFTHKYCEELLDKFVDIYKKNPEKICNSYKEAAYYFLSQSN